MGGQMPDTDEKARSADTSSSSYGYPSSTPPQHQHQYGTFGPPSGASGEFPQPAVRFPQPAPPPGMQHYPQPPPASYAVYLPPPQPYSASAAVYPPLQQPYSAATPYYAQGYQVAEGYILVVEGRPVRMRPLPCCGLGMGWFLFILGFFFAAIPWYIGAFVPICVRVRDYREKPGYVACTIVYYRSNFPLNAVKANCYPSRPKQLRQFVTAPLHLHRHAEICGFAHASVGEGEDDI